MSFNFRKIYAKDSIFVKVKEIHKNDHAYYQKYADNLTKQSGKAKNNKSGKARSYADYLIRLVIFYQEFFEEEVNNLLTFTTLKKLEKVVNSKNFNKYNKSENHFPSAAFNCYISCVTHLNAKKEERIDLHLNESLDITNIEESNNELNTTIAEAQKRKQKVNTDDVLTYPRKKEESLEAKRRSNWRCELDSNHTTFISNANKKPYMEAHHLIPMSAQDYFEYTLDFADNIVCLCPNCHRKIHHAIDEEKKEILQFLYKKREKKYNKYCIDISFKKILIFYEIV
jgi:5-methylcytosine-specific restriction enzyme A